MEMTSRQPRSCRLNAISRGALAPRPSAGKEQAGVGLGGRRDVPSHIALSFHLLGHLLLGYKPISTCLSVADYAKLPSKTAVASHDSSALKFGLFGMRAKQTNVSQHETPNSCSTHPVICCTFMLA